MASGRADVTRPFLAICVEHEGSIFEKNHQEYLVNPLDETLYRASVTTGGWFSTEEDGVINSSESSSTEVDVAPLSAVPTTLSTMDEYDEFVVWWTLKYTNGAGDPVTIQFSTFKRLKDVETSDDIPILRRAGFIVPQSHVLETTSKEEQP
jgi:hypothetical protein